MSTKAPETAVVAIDYTMIRQPYRITMAKWDYTVVQKRSITLIISSLQKEVLEKIDTSTSTPMGRLFFNFMAALAEFERKLIIERTMAGLKAARARGKSSGRPRGLVRMLIQRALAAYQLYQNKDTSVNDIIKHLSISKPIRYSCIRHIED
jgi:DNA invertase Pin-like site-specific DNA recombinase